VVEAAGQEMRMPDYEYCGIVWDVVDPPFSMSDGSETKRKDDERFTDLGLNGLFVFDIACISRHLMEHTGVYRVLFIAFGAHRQPGEV
jgi:hypothetical protein